MELIKKLNKIQKDLKAPKNQRNNFGNYNYRSCEDILEAVKPLLPEDLTLTIKDEILMIGHRFYVKATATLSDEKDSIDGVAYARESEDKKGMDSSQITGATSSYARKYALNGLFLIDDTKDADSQEPEQAKQSYTAPVFQSKPAYKPKSGYTTKEVGGTCPDCGGVYVKGKTGSVYCKNFCWKPENAHLKTVKNDNYEQPAYDPNEVFRNFNN